MFKKTLSKISIVESDLIFYRKKQIFLKISMSEIKNTFIKIERKNYCFYFIGLILVIVLVVYSLILKVSLALIFTLVMLLLYVMLFLLMYRTFSVVIELNNGLKHAVYFRSEKKYEFLEKIKIIRGKLTEAKFKSNE